MKKHISELLASILDEYDFGVDDMEDSYLKEYYGDKIFFSTDYLT